jgi:hypothetical protein
MKKPNRPESVDVRPRDALFSEVGQTGWKYKRDVSEHKQGKLEGDFHHLRSKFWSPGDGPVE